MIKNVECVAAQLGVSKVRITGGEPLTRRGIVDFIREVPKIPGIRDTNTIIAFRIYGEQEERLGGENPSG